jgi:glucosamine-6-phosphate deaminase
VTRFAPVACDSPEAVGRLAAELVLNRLVARPRARMLLPTGHTPRGMYAALRERAAADPGFAAAATVLALDEYAGIGPGDPRSFAATLRRELDGVALRALCTLDGRAGDLEAEADRHAGLLEQAPIDLAVLGLGRNGHVAFDEPGTGLGAGVRVVRLAATTREDAADDFAPGSPPEHGITTGLGTLLRCRELVLLVTGAAKATVLRDVLEGPPTPERPASLLRAHPRLTVLCDQAAASELFPSPARAARHAVIVLGHRDPGRSPEHRISHESLERLQRAERLVARDPARAVVLTGYTSTGGLSEAEQMAAAWTDPEVPFLLEVAGIDTAFNAARSLPLVQALGGIERVTVVTSFWHVRTPYFFAPYRERGLTVRLRAEWRGTTWPRMLAGELLKLPGAPRARRQAWTAPASGPTAWRA